MGAFLEGVFLEGAFGAGAAVSRSAKRPPSPPPLPLPLPLPPQDLPGLHRRAMGGGRRRRISPHGRLDSPAAARGPGAVALLVRGGGRG